MARNTRLNVSIGGKSLVFNILFILINLTGLTFITIGFHESVQENKLILKLAGMFMMLLSIVLLVIFQGRLLFANISRVLLGGLFIVSGLVKANDPLGFSYKLEEYFEDGALAYRIKSLFNAPGFTLEYLIDYALALSVIICIVEIVLGVLLIIGVKARLVSITTILMLIFFTFLTAHTATCDKDTKFTDRDTYSLTNPIAVTKIEMAKDPANKHIKIVSKTNATVTVDELKSPQCVDDCGCFGDAMKGSVGRSLTPYESLWKDIIVLYLAIWIFAAAGINHENKGKENAVYLLTSMLVVLFFSAVFSWYFPLVFALITVLGALWMLRAGGNVLGNTFGASLLVALISYLFIFFVLRYEPMKDYRPYSVGSNLKEKMNNGEAGVYITTLIYKNKKTGEERSFDASSKAYIDSKIWEDEDFEYFDTRQVTVKETKLPSITEQFNPFLALKDIGKEERELAVVQDFLDDKLVEVVQVKNLSSGDVYDVPMDEFTLEEYVPEYYQVLDTLMQIDADVAEFSIRDYITEVDQIILITSRNISIADWSSIDKYKKIYESAKQSGIPMVLITSTSRDKIDAFRKKHGWDIPVFNNDEIELKAIARSNPSMMIIQNGVIKGKYAHRSTPTVDWLKKNILIEKGE